MYMDIIYTYTRLSDGSGCAISVERLHGNRIYILAHTFILHPHFIVLTNNNNHEYFILIKKYLFY